MVDIQRVHHELSTNGNIRIMWKLNTILLPPGDTAWSGFFTGNIYVLAVQIALAVLIFIGIVKLFKFAFTFKCQPITKRTMLNSTILEKMIAEAAYYRAGQRGFSDGNDVFDWLEAEKEILERFSELRAI